MTWQYTPALMAGFIMPASQLESANIDELGLPGSIPDRGPGRTT